MRQALRFRTPDYMGGVAKVHERALVARAGSAVNAVTGRRTVMVLPPVPTNEQLHVTLPDGYTFPRLIRGPWPDRPCRVQPGPHPASF